MMRFTFTIAATVILSLGWLPKANAGPVPGLAAGYASLNFDLLPVSDVLVPQAGARAQHRPKLSFGFLGNSVNSGTDLRFGGRQKYLTNE